MPDEFVNDAYYTVTWPGRPGYRSEPVVVYDAPAGCWRYPGTGVRANLPETATYSRLYRPMDAADMMLVILGAIGSDDE